MDIASKIKEQKRKNKAKLEQVRQRITAEIHPQEFIGDELTHLTKIIKIEEEQTSVRDFANIEKFSSEISKQFSALYNENTRKQELLKFLTALNEFPSLVASIDDEARTILDKQEYDDGLLRHLVESIKTYEDVVTQLDVSLFRETKGSLTGILDRLFDFSVKELIAFDFKLQGNFRRIAARMVFGDRESSRTLSG